MAEHLARLSRLTYPLRILGMGLGAVVAMVVLYERDAPLVRWIIVAFGGFVWPHLAYYWAARHREPRRAEIRNLLIDSAFAGSFVALMEFNLLPSVLLVTLALVDKISTGIRYLWLRSLPATLAACAVTALGLGMPVALESSMRVVLACLPVLVLHTLSVSVVSYQLIRKVSQQNALLDELRRIDTLTGLYGRAHWEQQVHAALAGGAETSEPAALLMLDLDSFKSINDVWGHAAGDDVIRAMSHVLRSCVRASDCAGRYGGDEFAVLLRGTSATQANEIAQRIRTEVESHRFRDRPELRFTCSIGVAKASPRHATPGEWMAAADAALYRAKRGGRNRVERAPDEAVAVAA